MNGILGDTSLHSTWCKSLRCCGISGKPIPFAVELGGIFFFFKWLKHVLQINWFPSFRRLSPRHTSTALQSGRLFFCTITTLCLYQSWSHTQHLCTGPFPTSWWKFFIKSSRDNCLLLNDFLRSVSCICSRILFAESFRTIFLLFVSHCCSFCLYSGFSLAICLLILLDSRSLSLNDVFFLTICILVLSHTRSLSLYARSFLAICLLFIWLSRSLSLYAGFFLIICMLFLLHSRSLSLYPASSLAIFILALVCCLSYSLNSGCDLARLFHSTVYCCLFLCLNWTELLSNISLSAFWTLSSVSTLLFLDLCLRAKSFCDCKYLSTIAWAEGTFSIAELPTVLFLHNNSPLFDVDDLPSPLSFFAVFEFTGFTSDVFVPILTTSLASVCAALSSLLRTLSCLWRCLSLFLFTFGMLCQWIDQYCTHLAICPSYLLVHDRFVEIFSFLLKILNAEDRIG